MKYTVSAELGIEKASTKAIMNEKNLNVFYYDRAVSEIIKKTTDETLLEMEEANKKLKLSGFEARFVTKIISDPLEKSEAFKIFNILESSSNVVTYPKIVPAL